MATTKSNHQFWTNLSDQECVSELNKFNLISLKSVLWGDTAYKYLSKVKSGEILFSQIQDELKYLVTSSLGFLFESFEKEIVKGFNVYLFECGLSFKTVPIIDHGLYALGFGNVIEGKDIAQCENILKRGVWQCVGNRFYRTHKEQTYIRRCGYRKMEMAIISETFPKITQKEVRKIIEDYQKLNYPKL